MVLYGAGMPNTARVQLTNCFTWITTGSVRDNAVSMHGSPQGSRLGLLGPLGIGDLGTSGPGETGTSGPGETGTSGPGDFGIGLTGFGFVGFVGFVG